MYIFLFECSSIGAQDIEKTNILQFQKTVSPILMEDYQEDAFIKKILKTVHFAIFLATAVLDKQANLAISRLF